MNKLFSDIDSKEQVHKGSYCRAFELNRIIIQVMVVLACYCADKKMLVFRKHHLIHVEASLGHIKKPTEITLNPVVHTAVWSFLWHHPQAKLELFPHCFVLWSVMSTLHTKAVIFYSNVKLLFKCG